MSELTKLYTKRLEQLGTTITVRVHSTKLKDRILSYFPDNKDIREALHKACEHDNDNEAITLSRAASIVRRDMLKMKLTFNCSFGSDSTPASLLALVYMGLYGASITSQTTVSSTPQPALTILQLLRFNSSACKKVKQSPDVPRHNAARETSLPIYLGIMLHSKTRKRELVDKLFELGLTVSYDRVLNISTELGNKVCHHYETKGVVCPPELKGGLFTTAAIDNIDHGPSSTSSHDLFHGTGISLFQHPADTFAGLDQINQ